MGNEPTLQKGRKGERRTHGLFDHSTLTQPKRGADITIIGFSPRTNIPLIQNQGRNNIKILFPGQIF